MAITCDEFIKLVKSDPDKWKYYCEILLGPHGEVIMLDSSHQEAAIEYMSRITGKTRNEVSKMLPPDMSPFHLILDKYKLVGIWYKFYYYSSSGLNRFQKKSINKLINNGILPKDIEAIPVNEYKLYKQRVKLGISKYVEGL